MNKFINIFFEYKKLGFEKRFLNDLTNILFFDVLTDDEKEHLINLLKDNLEFLRSKKQ